MFCEYCGKEIPDGSGFCNFCGESLTGTPGQADSKGSGVPDRQEQIFGGEADSGTDIPSDKEEFYGEGSEYDGYEVYDSFGTVGADAPSDGDGLTGYEDFETEYDPFVAGYGDEAPPEKTGRGAAAACVVLSVLMCLFIVVTALSGIARYVTRDPVIRKTVIKNGIDDYPVDTGTERKSFSEFLCDIIEASGKDLGFKRRDINKLLKEEPLNEYFADVFIEYKHKLFKGEYFSDQNINLFNCGEIADWMYKNADTVKRITGVSVDAGARDQLKNGLKSNTLELGGNSFEELFGMDRGLAMFFLSDIFFYISLVLTVGLAALIFICSDFNLRFFFSCMGAVLLSAGIILLAFFGLLMIAGSGTGFLTSALLSASLMPFIIVCGASVLLGTTLEVICYVIGKKGRRSRKKH